MRAGRMGGYFMIPIHRDEVDIVRRELDRAQRALPVGLPRIVLCKVLDRLEQIVAGGMEERAVGGASKAGT